MKLTYYLDVVKSCPFSFCFNLKQCSLNMILCVGLFLYLGFKNLFCFYLLYECECMCCEVRIVDALCGIFHVGPKLCLPVVGYKIVYACSQVPQFKIMKGYFFIVLFYSVLLMFIMRVELCHEQLLPTCTWCTKLCMYPTSFIYTDNLM